jgi:hypothetical protein
MTVMASRRLGLTLADHLASAICPVLIMTLVGSLVFFLLEVFYHGQYLGRLQWVFGCFVFATVLIARISMMYEGHVRAPLYGIVLAGVALLALWYLMEYPTPLLQALAWPINIFLLAVVWWCTHKLTYDCTYEDEAEQAGDRGLLDAAGWDEQSPSAVPDATPPPKKKHTPGLWVLYFSLAALPLYGLGQVFLPADKAMFGATLLAIYLASGLGLLVCTSFLNLRRYLRQRKVSVPGTVTLAWVGLGSVWIVVLVGAGLMLAMLSPGSWSEQVTGIGSRDRQASRFALFRDSPGKGPGRASHVQQADPQGQARSQGQSSSDSSAQGRSQSGQGSRSGDASRASQSRQGDPQGQPRSPGQSPSDSSAQGRSQSGQGSRSGDASRASQSRQGDPQGQPLSPGQSSSDSSAQGRSQSGQGYRSQSGDGSRSQARSAGGRSASGQRAGTEQKGQSQQGQGAERSGQQDNAGTSRPSDPQRTGEQEPQNQNGSQSDERTQDSAGQSRSWEVSTPSGNWLLAPAAWIGTLVKWLAILALVVVGGYVVVRFLARSSGWFRDLLAFLQRLFGRESPEQPAAGWPEEASAGPPRPFADYPDPFLTGLADRWPAERLVRYSFDALQSWAWERNLARRPQETPLEFVQRVGVAVPELAAPARRLGELYARVCFARQVPGTAVDRVREFWSAVSLVPARPLASSDASSLVQ